MTPFSPAGKTCYDGRRSYAPYHQVLGSVLNNHTLLIIAIGVGLTCCLAILAILASGKKPLYRRRGRLLLLNEQRFMVAALQALPPDSILTMKVRLVDIISSTSAKTGKNLDSDLFEYNVDFVILDRESTQVRLCIEMIMEGRSNANSALLGRALRRAGIAHLKLPLVRFYDPARLRQIFQDALREAGTSSPTLEKTDTPDLQRP